MALTITQAAAQSLRRQVHVLSPAAAETLQKLRDLLYASADRDVHPPLCDFSKDPADTWYPYGQDTECRIRHARSPGSEFRKGIHWTFQHDWSTKQEAHSKELVEPITKLLVSEAMMQEPEARNIVWNHYNYVYGHFPTPDLPAIEPSRVPQVVVPKPHDTPPSGAPVPIPPPLPFPGEEGGDLAPGAENGGLATQPTGEFPWMWVGIGAGALVLVGGVVYFATRKS
jgi:hypothetical protein